jgi:mevalonate pyrophosphate decarboxylase
VESVSMATVDRFGATSAKVMEVGGHVSLIANGVTRTQSKDAKTSSVVRLNGLRFRSG